MFIFQVYCLIILLLLYYTYAYIIKQYHIIPVITLQILKPLLKFTE